MSVATISQFQTNNFQPVVPMEDNGDFNAPANSGKKMSYHDFEILDFKKKENGPQKNQDKKIKSSKNSANHSEKLQIEGNTQILPHDVEFEFSDFNSSFNFEIVDINWSLSSNEIVLYLDLDRKLLVKATLEGNWEQTDEPKFQLKNFGLKLAGKQETPISIFLTSTLWAILGLSSNFRVRIPQLNYDLTASFELPFNEVSKLLQERQIAYRLMVIETALGIYLPFPQGFIDGKDVENIAFCYHAIVDREFEWFANPQIIPLTANEDSLSWLPKTPKPTVVIYKPEPVTKTVFGVEIPLGIMTGRIEKTVIDNYEEVKENLSKLDGSIVNTRQRSISGTIKMIALDVPQLPPNSWNKNLQKLIDLDEKLDSMYFDKYLSSFSNAFEGLTDEQIQAITERPDLEEEAFNF